MSRVSAVLIWAGLAGLAGCSDTTSPEAPDLSVTVNTTGVDPDADGYYVSIAGANRPVGASGAAEFKDLASGEYDVTLGGVAFNCTVTSPNPQHVTITASSQAVVFEVACEHTPLIAFVSDANGSTQIYVKRPDGTGRRQLTNTIAANENPVWSPDGSRIAFISRRDGNPEIYVMNADGGGVRRLTNDPGIEGIPVWSPNGSKLAFTRAANQNAKPAIFVINADGTNAINVSMDDTRYNLSPDWSPDGTRLVYNAQQYSCCQTGESDLRIVNADGTGRTTIVSNVIMVPNYKTTPKWSPDGTRLAFIDVVTVAVMNVDGSQTRDLPGTAYANLVDWSPDGQELLLDMGSDIQVFNMAANGVRNVTNNGTSIFEYSESWSPDGSKIIYKRGPGVYVINKDGTAATNLSTDGFDEWQPAWRP